MTYYSLASLDFFEQITDPSLRWTREVARSAGIEAGAIRMGNEAAESPPMTEFLLLRPDAVLPRHAHDCHRVEVVCIGSLIVSGGKVLGPGDLMISHPGEFCGPHRAGPEGALLIEIFSDANAKTVFADVEFAGLEHAAAEGKARAREYARTVGRRRGSPWN